MRSYCNTSGRTPWTCAPVVDSTTILALQDEVRTIHLSDAIRHYILEVVRSTREHAGVDLGVSPRGSLALFRASKRWPACVAVTT